MTKKKPEDAPPQDAALAEQDAPPQDAALAEQDAPSDNALTQGIDFTDDIGGGAENVDIDSIAIPFLRALQKISKQVDEAESVYIEGAKHGMLYNSVTNQLFDGEKGVLFLPCAFQRRFLRWGPRGSDRGYLGDMLPEEVAALEQDGTVATSEDGRLYFPEGPDDVYNDKKHDRLVDTRSHFGLLLDEDGVTTLGAVLIPLSSTQIKKSKQLMAMLTSVKTESKGRSLTPPTWLNKVRITTVAESNDQGSWHGMKFTAEGFIENVDTYNEGKAFSESVNKGAVSANFAETEDGASAQPDGKF